MKVFLSLTEYGKYFPVWIKTGHRKVLKTIVRLVKMARFCRVNLAENLAES